MTLDKMISTLVEQGLVKNRADAATIITEYYQAFRGVPRIYTKARILRDECSALTRRLQRLQRAQV